MENAKVPTLKQACLMFGGVYDDENKARPEYQVPTEGAEKVLELLGYPLRLLPNRNIIVTFTLMDKTHFTVEVPSPSEKNDPRLRDFFRIGRRQVRTFEFHPTEKDEEVEEIENIRQLLTPGRGRHAYWVLLDSRGHWVENPPSNIESFLQNLGNSRTEAREIMGGSIRRSWEIAVLPFQPEYPGDGKWNRRAAQLRYEPIEGGHPTWDRVFNHVGQELDAILPTLQWAVDGGIKTGGDYLRAWTASVIQFPFDQLPYLFLHGPEESGKSTFWEVHNTLFTEGVVKADKALTSKADFNGELEGAVICAVDEKDLRTQGAMEKMRDAVTATFLNIRKMRTDAYDVPNTTHWIQCGNKLSLCPIPKGDTRVTVLYVPLPDEDIPKSELIERLELEAGAFTHTLLHITLPQPSNRLRLPVVDTASKDKMFSEQDGDRPKQFINEWCECGPEFYALCEDLRKEFHLFCYENDYINEWMSVTSFGIAMAALGFENRRKMVDGTQQHVYVGVRRKV